MTVPNLMSKAFSYQNLRKGEGGKGAYPPEHDQTKIPRADRVNKTVKDVFSLKLKKREYGV